MDAETDFNSEEANEEGAVKVRDQVMDEARKVDALLNEVEDIARDELKALIEDYHRFVARGITK